MSDPNWSRSFTGSHVQLNCSCGWTGHDNDIVSWAVDTERDRVVRQCPGCSEIVPEWGVVQPIDGATKIARGPLADALAESEQVAATEPPL